MFKTALEDKGGGFTAGSVWAMLCFRLALKGVACSLCCLLPTLHTDGSVLLDAAPARLTYCTRIEKDVIEPGRRVFRNRDFGWGESLPQALRGRYFLRAGIDGFSVEVASAGVMTVLTPKIMVRPPSASKIRELTRWGFRVEESVPVFQPFGANEIDQVVTMRKAVRPGERFTFAKWCIVVDVAADSSSIRREDIAMETLYNGIRLESDPQERTELVDEGLWPQPVPYLKNPPSVICVDVGRQLFVDDFLVADTTMVRTWHKPRKDRRNPLLKPETLLERGLARSGRQAGPMAAPFSGGVWYDGLDGLFKCWYCAGWQDSLAYAYSTNGLDWVRPELKVLPGSNRVVQPPAAPDGSLSRRDSTSVILDPDAKDGMRYKLLMWSRPQCHGDLFVSPDGVNWSAPVPMGFTGDRTTMFYNPFRKVWSFSLRHHLHGRSRRYAESRDFLAGAPLYGAVVWLRADNHDMPGDCFFYADPSRKGESFVPQLYNFDAVAYESLMLGAYTIMQGPENDVCNAADLPKMTELHLGFSRDGFHFSRPADRSPFIGGSRKAGTWDMAYVHSCSSLCLVMGDELWFYYTAFAGKGKENAKTKYSGVYSHASMGLARLRRDGFASMDAVGREDASLLTRPISFSRGDRLFVNVNSAGGELRAEVILEDGTPAPGFGAGDCVAISQNATCAEVRWRGGSLAPFRGRRVQLRFIGRETELYAFWFSDAGGHSRGYLAGGGPGHRTLKDE